MSLYEILIFLLKASICNNEDGDGREPDLRASDRDCDGEL